MTDKIINKLTHLLKKQGLQLYTIIKKDDFNRYNGIIIDKNKRKYFFKAVAKTNNYQYHSLYKECQISKYLSSISNNYDIKYKGYKLRIPQVINIIENPDFLCLISKHVIGINLQYKRSYEQARILIVVDNLINNLSDKINPERIKIYLKIYSKKAILLNLPIKIIIAIIYSPSAALNIIKIIPTVLYLINLEVDDYKLIHADVNSSNILINGHTIYLTDWEEAGWGISTNNIIHPLSVHWLDSKIKFSLIKYLNIQGHRRFISPLLGYHILTLLTQKIQKDNPKRIRDYQLLKDFTVYDYSKLSI
jgi:hypothetical protein